MNMSYEQDSAAPVCGVHGVPMRWKPPGTSKTTGKPYQGFWSCGTKNDDGSWCRYKPPQQQKAAGLPYQPAQQPQQPTSASAEMLAVLDKIHAVLFRIEARLDRAFPERAEDVGPEDFPN